MAFNKAYNTYRENSIVTASPEELTLMLYNGLIRFMLQAQHAIDEKQLAKAHENIIKAENIIKEFMITLDHKYEIADSFAMLYDYMYRRLVEANLKKDKEILQEILHIATELRDTWAQAMKINKQQNLEKLGQSQAK